jgi:hypothetical protein
MMDGFSIQRKSAGIGGIFIGVDWCNKEFVKKYLGEPRNVYDDDENGGVNGLRWNWGDEFNDLDIVFDTNGLVRSIRFDRRRAD